MNRKGIFYAITGFIAIGAIFAYNLELGETQAFEDEQFEAHNVVEKISRVGIDEQTCQDIYPHKIGVNAPCFFGSGYLAIYLNNQYMLHDAKTRALVMTIKIIDDHYSVEATEQEKNIIFAEFRKN